jgi:ATP-dependent protease ClpP protease subunit
MNKVLAASTTLLAAMILAMVLMSGKATINFNHKPNISELKSSPHYKIVYNGSTPSIYLSTKIDAPDQYIDLIAWINNNTQYKSINVYLIGYGGRVDSTLMLVSAMRDSPTVYQAVVIGNVYSAHAFLSVNLDTVRSTNPNFILSFHRPARQVNGEYIITGQDCKDRKGKDRGISNKIKCADNAKALNSVVYNTIEIIMIQYLTDDEIKAYWQGHDVIIHAYRLREI